MYIYKFLAAIIGYFLGGFLGSISAFLLAWELFDKRPGVLNKSESQKNKKSESTNRSSESKRRTNTNTKSDAKYRQRREDIFELSLLRLSTLMIKADGKIKQEEIQLVQQFFLKNFGEVKAKRLFREVKEMPTSMDNLEAILLVLKSRIEPSNYFGIIQFLYAIAFADDELEPSEDEFIFKVGKIIGLSDAQIRQIRNQFLDDNAEDSNPEAVRKKHLDRLGLSGNPTKEEIKAAFRKLAKEYHPDKLAGVDEAIKKISEEKFKEIMESYEYLSKAA